MTSLQNLHSAIGVLAYTIARADGQMERSEAAAFLKIVSSELDDKNYDFDMVQLIFDMMTKDKMDMETTYNWAMQEIKINNFYLSPVLKKKFIALMEKITTAFPAKTLGGVDILQRFKENIAHLDGDPFYHWALGSNRHS